MEKEKQDGNDERKEVKKIYRRSKEEARERAFYERVKSRIRGSKPGDFIDIEDWGVLVVKTKTAVVSTSTTSSLKNQQLTFKEKQYVMLKDLEVELQQFRSTPHMEWWCLTLERKIKELKDAI